MLEKSKESHLAALTDLQSEFKSLKALFLNQRRPIQGTANSPSNELNPDITSQASSKSEPVESSAAGSSGNELVPGGMAGGSMNMKSVSVKPAIPSWQLEPETEIAP